MSPSFSKDGKKISFARATRERNYSLGGRTWDDWDVWQMNADGTGEERLTWVKYYGITAPHYLFEGNAICYSGSSHNPASVDSHVYTVALNLAGKPIQIDSNKFSQSHPYPSPDGKRYLSIDNVLGDYNYRVVEHTFGQSVYKIIDTQKYSTYPESPIYAQDGESAYYLGDPVSFEKPHLLKLNLHTGVSISIHDFTLFEDPLKGMSGSSVK